MEDDQPLLFAPEELPQTDEPKKEKVSPNCLQEIMIELMNRDKVQLADIHKATGIPFPTLQDWITQNVKRQMLDKNILELAKFFNVSLFYLVYGIGDDSPAFERLED